tara:strand:+ start:12748 stop:13935 length:1188 start_codon:yes stop_codon:yes gene_type:complete
MKKQFLDLGRQPIANGFLNKNDFANEYFFNLKVGFDDETKLVSLMDFVEPTKMFNDEYVYYSSLSKTMREHFLSAAETFKTKLFPQSVLEIGSNDGVFIENFSPDNTCAVEPCGNFADITNKKGYHTYPQFWNLETAEEIVERHGPQDLIFSANCMCHIQDLNEAFTAVKKTLSFDGCFVFEDPSLLQMITRGSYDQIYDEHAHIFSVVALKNLLNNVGLEIFKVEKLDVHGGSNRIYAKHMDTMKLRGIKPAASVQMSLDAEREYGLHKYETYVKFADRVEKSKNDLLSLLQSLKAENKKIVSYGATSKSTTVFNYCGIDNTLIDYIVDTTADKQNKFSPGVHIPVVPPTEFDNTVDCAFLGAWNYKKEILNKEKRFVERGGVFITHVPAVGTY